jgi:hypothetical protein
MPQTRKEKRAGAIRRLERYIVDCQRALQHGGSDEEIQAQTKRKEHLECLKSIKERR